MRNNLSDDILVYKHSMPWRIVLTLGCIGLLFVVFAFSSVVVAPVNQSASLVTAILLSSLVTTMWLDMYLKSIEIFGDSICRRGAIHRRIDFNKVDLLYLGPKLLKIASKNQTILITMEFEDRDNLIRYVLKRVYHATRFEGVKLLGNSVEITQITHSS